MADPDGTVEATARPGSAPAEPGGAEAPSYAQLDREHRLALRRLHRLEDNALRLENIQDSNSRLLSRLLTDLDQERQRSHELLLNVLPQRIIDRLASGERVIADRHDDVTVLFLDVVGFTAISSRLTPADLVERLNALFSAFDAICAETGVEKIKTVGDAYLVVAGLAAGVGDHPAAVADTALRMLDAVGSTGEDTAGAGAASWSVRIGISRGPVVAGVIGSTKFAYDVWGDTVNLASRLQTAAAPGQVLVSEAIARSLETVDGLEVEAVGSVELKGKGPTPAWSLRPARERGRAPGRASR